MSVVAGRAPISSPASLTRTGRRLVWVRARSRRCTMTDAENAFKVTLEPEPSSLRVVVAGELDMASAPQIEEEMSSVEQQDPSVILLDLRELSFMDSSGLRAVLTADARARDQGRRLVVIRGSENIQRVFAVTRLDERMEFVDDPSDAV